MAGSRLVEMAIKARPQQTGFKVLQLFNQLIAIDANSSEVELIVGGHGQDVGCFTPFCR
ncbi:hypothetical protein D3C86_2028900 [compost metagenome]